MCPILESSSLSLFYSQWFTSVNSFFLFTWLYESKPNLTLAVKLCKNVVTFSILSTFIWLVAKWLNSFQFEMNLSEHKWNIVAEVLTGYSWLSDWTWGLYVRKKVGNRWLSSHQTIQPKWATNISLTANENELVPKILNQWLSVINKSHYLLLTIQAQYSG